MDVYEWFAAIDVSRIFSCLALCSLCPSPVSGKWLAQVGLFKLTGEVFAFFFVDRTGRRPLLLTSSGLVTFFLFILGEKQTVTARRTAHML